MSDIPFDQFGGKGSPIVFAHANGFPPKSYSTFLNLFQNNEVLALEQRPLWEQWVPKRKFDWNDLADDLIAFIEQQKLHSVIGIGHSLGAIAVMFAAIKRPDLFKSIILIEPVFLESRFILITKISPLFLKKKFNPLIVPTLRRRNQFDSKEDAYSSYRRKANFKNIPNKQLQEYVDSQIVANNSGSGFTLRYSRDWEAHFYAQAPLIWHKITKIKVPVLGVRGDLSNTISKSSWEKWKRLDQSNKLIEFAGAGHLIPLEQPGILYNKIQLYLKELN